MKSLGKIVEGVASGVHPSLPPEKVPLWIDGRNTISIEKSIQPMPGQITLFQKPEANPVIGVEENLVNGTKYVFFGTKTKLYYWRPGDAAATDVTRLAGAYTGDDSTKWSMVPWGTFMLASNYKDEVQVWDPASPANFVNISALASSDLLGTERCEIVAALGPFAFMFNTDLGEYICRWADEDSLIAWNAALANLAGDLALRDLRTAVNCVVPLASGLGVYGLDKLSLVAFIGSPNVFGQVHLADGVGAFGKHSVVAVDRMNYGMGPRGLFQTDGSAVRYIDSPSIRDFIYDDLNKDRAFTSTVWHDPNLQLVCFSYPQAGQLWPSITVTWRYANDTWGILDYGRSSASHGGVFDSPLTGSAGGYVLRSGTFGTVPSSVGVPLIFYPTAQADIGYGEGGYGEFGYGGRWTGDG